MTLAELLAPVTLAEFLASYSQQRALYIPGTPAKLAGMFDRERLLAIVRRLAATRSTPDAPSFRAAYRARDGEHREIAISAFQVEAMLELGATVFADRIDAEDAALAALAFDTRGALAISEAVDIGVFVSPRDSGYGLHFDAVPNWVIQLEGRKRWRYSELPAVTNPERTVVPDAAQRAAYGVREHELATVDLAPGDVLYLPPGAWHHPRGLDDVSVHLSMIARTEPTAPVLEILEHTRLERVRELRYAIETRGDEQALLLLDGPEVIAELPGDAEAFVEGIARTAEFVARDVLAWGDYEWTDVTAVLAELVALGVVRTRGDQP